MFGVGKKSLLDPEEETFVIDIEEENEGYDGDRMKRAADGGDKAKDHYPMNSFPTVQGVHIWKLELGQNMCFLQPILMRMIIDHGEEYAEDY